MIDQLPLPQQLKCVLASFFMMYTKTKGFHWNVEGNDFPQLHELFDDIASDVYDSIDPVAEYIRGLDQYAITSLEKMKQLSLIADNQPQAVQSARSMVEELTNDNERMMSILKDVIECATRDREHAIANFLSDRLGQHQKWRWQLKATLK